MLPTPLLLLVLPLFANAQEQLTLNSTRTFAPNAVPSQFKWIIPASPQLSVSVALCATSSARWFLSNASISATPGSDGGGDVYELDLTTYQGLGNFTGPFPRGGVLRVENSTALEGSFEIGVNVDGPLHQRFKDPPYLGDTTGSMALLFSRPFGGRPFDEPKWPNYTLPVADAPLPVPPDSPSNYTLVIAETSNSIASAIPQTGCALRSSSMNLLSNSSRANVRIVDRKLWLRDEKGWREQWVIDGLRSSSNYTYYVLENGVGVSGPAYFVTKDGNVLSLLSTLSLSNKRSIDNYACTLTHSLTYCPNVAYSIPLAPPTLDASFSYNSTTLPSSISSGIIEYMTNFTTTLSTFACGRDAYSPLQTCNSCSRAYRNWLCLISLPRCFPSAQTNSTAASSRITSDFDLPDSQVLLPCIESCTSVDRACPNFLGFRCPRSKFGAARSYAVGWVDSTDEGGQEVFEGRGRTGASQDVWGNVWCGM